MADNFNVTGSVGQLQNNTHDSSQVSSSDTTTITMNDLRQIKRESIIWSIVFAIITGIISSLIFEIFIKGLFSIK
ncbi:hypothetical protein K2X92_03725 [Candidatus Gracilibacteria bacterium]|nr:hypothetical protein [Candidatus Gracilibacteria bacterium]